ncbi:hypothetical protein [Microterricola viridarii]|uniref:Lipocalin-like domain-containing protein n=1 Tax=Microterricola viridarii TaxID=412690 RepID=A0A109QX14_9MICO|nr:hypothetical protein [Microterricola viridarii]AMB58894.1 hypothetical protein AWU67_08450 [Microterricola viridarii]
MVKRVLGASLVAAAIVLFLAGCGGHPVVMDEAEIVGEWVSSGPNDEIASLTFAGDGTFSYTGMPKGLFCAEGFDHRIMPDDWAEPDSSSGTWRMSQVEAVSLPLKLIGGTTGCGTAGQFTERDDSIALTLTFGRLDEGSPELRFHQQSG